MAISHWWLGTDGGSPTDPTVAVNWSTTGSGGVPGGSVPGTGDEVQFDGGGDNPCTLVGDITWGGLTTLVGYAAKLDLGNGGHTLTMDDGADITLDQAGEFDCGDATISLTNGNFDNNNVGTFIRGSSTLVMGGTGNITSHVARAINHLTILSGAVITVVTSTRAYGITTIDGTLLIDASQLYSSIGQCKTTIGVQGRLTGGGRYFVHVPGNGEGITSFNPNGTIDVAWFHIWRPQAGSVWAEGVYECALFEVSNDSALNYTFTLDGSYTFTGDLIFRNEGAGDMIINNVANDPDIECWGDVTLVEDSGTLQYDAGAGDMTLAQTATQNIDFAGKATEDLVIDKTSSGDVILANGDLELQDVDMAGDLTVTGSTLTASADAKHVGGDVNWSDAGNVISCGAATWTFDGDFDFSAIGTLTRETGVFVLTGNGPNTVAGAGTGEADKLPNMTFAENSSYQITVSARTVDLILAAGATVDVANGQGFLADGDTSILSGAEISGTGSGFFWVATGDIIQQDGEISADCQMQGNSSMVGGNYSGLLKFLEPGINNRTMAITGAFTVGTLEFETTSSGNITIDATGMDSMTVAGDTTIDMDGGGGDITIDNAGGSATWELQGDVINQVVGDTFLWVVGGAILQLGGTGNQTIDLEGMTVPELTIDKQTSGDVTLEFCDVELQAVDMAGDLAITDSTLTASADAKHVVGDVDWSDAGNDISCGTGTVWTFDSDFDFNLIGAIAEETATFVLTGTGKTIAGNGGAGIELYGLTFGENSSYEVTEQVNVAAGGALLFESGAVVELATPGRFIRATSGCTVQIESGVIIDSPGSGYVYLVSADVIQQDGNIASLLIAQNTCELVGGNYSGGVRFSVDGAVNNTSIMTGDFTVGTIEFQTTSSGNLTIDATGLTSMTVTGNTTIDMNGNGGDITINNDGVFELQGDVINEVDGDTFTWNVGTGTLQLGGTGHQTIDLEGMTVPELTIDKTTSGNVTLEFCDVELQAVDMAGDLAITDSTLTASADAKHVGGDVNWSDAGNVISCGTGTVWTFDGDFDFQNIDTLTKETGVFVMTGSSPNALAGAGDSSTKRPHSITFGESSNYSVDANTGVIDGLLLFESNATVEISNSKHLLCGGGTTQVQSGATISRVGNGYLWMAGSNVTLQDGDISAELKVSGNSSLVGGIYSGLIKFLETGASNRTMTITGDFTVGTLEFETTSTGNVTIDAVGLTSITVTGNTTVDMDGAGGDITIDNTGNTATWDFQGDIIDEKDGDTFTWTSGDGSITFTGVANQDVDFLGQTIEDVTVNKSAGKVTLTGNMLPASFTGVDGTLDSNGFNITTTGDMDWQEDFVIDDPVGSIFAVGGDFTANAQSITSTGTWYLRVDGTAVASGVGYVDNSNANGFTTIAAAAGPWTHDDPDTNLNWLFTIVSNAADYFTLPSRDTILALANRPTTWRLGR